MLQKSILDKSIAGKDCRSPIETKVQALGQARLEFKRRKLQKHEAAFIEGYVSAIRGGYFTEIDHIEVVGRKKKEK